MAKSCLRLSDPKVLGVVENSRKDFEGIYNDNQLLALTNIFYDKFGELPNSQQLKEFYAEKINVTSKEAFDQLEIETKDDILDILQSVFFEAMYRVSKGKPLTTSLINKYKDKVLATIPQYLDYHGLNEIKDNYDEYQKLLLASRLKQLNIEFDEDLDVLDNQSSKDNQWDRDSTKEDSFQKASNEVKFLFASLISPNTIRGLSKPLPLSYTWNIVQNLLGGSTDLETQVNILRTAQLDYPWIKQILDKIGFGNFDSLSEAEYNAVRTSFFDAFAKANNTLIMGVPGKDTVDNIESTLEQNIVQQWQSNFRSSDYTKIIGTQRVLDPTKIEEIENSSDLELLQKLGINLTNPDEKLVTQAAFNIRKYFLAAAKKSPKQWINDKSLTDKESVNTTLKDLLRHEVTQQKVERPLGARNAAGEYQHGVGLHDYFTKVVGKLKHGVRKATNTFESLFAEGRVVTGIHQGVRVRGDSKEFNKLNKSELYQTFIADMFSSNPIIHIPRTSDKTTENLIKIIYNRQIAGTLSREQYLNGIMAFSEIGDHLYKRMYDQYSKDFIKRVPKGWTAKGIKEPNEFWVEMLDITGMDKLPFSEFKSKLESFVNNQIGPLFQELIGEKVISEDKLVPMFDSIPNYSNLSLENKQLAIKNLLKNYIFNTIMFGTEYTQMTMGSLNLVNPEEFFKRTAGPIAEGKIPRSDETMNKQLESERPEYMNEFPTGGSMKVTISEETEITSSKEFLDNIKKLIDKGVLQPHVLEKYKKNNVDDAQGVMVFESYMEWKKRLNEWTPKQEEAWKKLQKGQLTTKEFKDAFPPTKPVGYTLINVDGMELPIYLKTSVYPIHPNLVKGTLNEKLYNKMIEKGVSLHLPKSGIKLAIPKNLKPQFENGEATLNDEATFEIPVSDFVSQLDVAPKDSLKQLIGTQQQKLIASNLYENAKVVNPDLATWMERRLDTLQKFIDIERKQLEGEAGIALENGLPVINNYSKLKEMLKDELMSRDMPLNVIEAINGLIDTNGNLIGEIDTFPSRQKLMNLMNSIVTNKLIKLYTNGSALIQVSQAGWELAKIENATDENIKAIETSIDFVSPETKIDYYKNNGLRFFQIDKTTGEAEVLLDAKFKPFVKDGKIDPKLLVSIGYRIPTQGLNSILHLKVAGFLPIGYNQMIVMPKEITTQGGSDFDVDKINIFFPNSIYVDGKLQYISSDMNPSEIYEKVQNEKDLKGLTEEEIEQLNKLQAAMFGDLDLLEETDENEIKKKENWTTNFRKKQLQNELIEQSLEILRNEASQGSLLNPNSSDELKDLADKYSKAEKVKSSEKFNPKVLVDMTFQMYSAKALVGVFASQSTNHVLGQQVGLHFKSTPRPFYFKHNENEFGKPSLAGVRGQTFDNKYYIITDRLGNQYITASVDAAKDPFLFRLGCTLDTGAIFALYERLGGNIEELVLLIKQPIIQEYLKERALNKRIGLQGNETKSKVNIIEAILSKKEYGFDKTKSEYLTDKYNKSEVRDAILETLRKERNIWGNYSEKKGDTLSYDKLNGENIPSEDFYRNMQRILLDDFLYLEDAAQVVSKMIATTKFDTAGPGKDVIQSLRLKDAYNTFVNEMNGDFGYTLGTIGETEETIENETIEENVSEEPVIQPEVKEPILTTKPAITPYTNLIDKTLLKLFKQNSFDFTLSMYKDMVLLLKNPEVGKIFELLTNPSEYVLKEIGEDEATLVYSTVINYVLQKNLGLNKDLFFGENTVANKILQIQKDENHPLHNNYLFTNVFTPEISGNTELPSILSLMNKNIDSRESDFIFKAFVDLKNSDPKLYNDLMQITVFQTGVTTSPVSFYGQMPYTDVLPFYQSLLANNSIMNKEAVIKNILANVGEKMGNLRRLKYKQGFPTFSSILNFKNDPINGMKYMIYSQYDAKNKVNNVGIFEREGDTNNFNLIPSQNLGGLFYNLTNFAIDMDSDFAEIKENEENFEEEIVEDYFELLHEDNKKIVLSKITPQEYNEMSNEEREIFNNCNLMPF
jgi:hypothetical protein